VLFVAGKLHPDTLSLLNTYFGDLPIHNHKGFYEALAINTQLPVVGGKHQVTNDPNGVQGAIRIARPFPNRHHPDYTRVMVLNTVFGGFFGSRLMANIREDKGYTYGIHSYVQNHIGTTAWMISTEAGRDVCAPAIAEIYKEMKILRNELVDEEELLLVRNYMMGIILGDLDGPFQIIGRWKNIVLNNLSSDYFYHSIDTIKRITAADVQALANTYLQPEQFYELLVI
jgi:predicted Zn-dependent peptidase